MPEEIEEEYPLKLRGVHGTCKSREKKIREERKFRPSSSGRLGSGIYFWRTNALAFDLARAWFDQKHKDNEYKDEPEQGYAPIQVEIDVKEQNFLDLEDPDFKDNLASILKTKQSNGTKLNESQYLGLLSTLIKRWEEKTGKIVEVLQSRVAPPDNHRDKYPLNYLGAPLCYVVKNADCITIK